MTDPHAETQDSTSVSSSTTQQDNIVMDKRTTLTGYFSDNETPTGDNFRELIEASVVQGDDGLNINEGNLELANNLKVAGGISVAAGTQLSHQELILDNGQAILSPEALKVGETLLLTEEDGLTINAPMNVSHNTLLQGSVAINSSELDADSALLVKGQAKILGSLVVAENVQIQADVSVAGKGDIHGDLQVDQTLTLGSDAHSGQLNLRHQGQNSSVQVQHTNEQNQTTTQLCLDESGRLSLGLDPGQAEAQLHIYHGGSNNEAIFKVDDTAEDARPFIIKGDGRVGIATASPENELDVAGSVRIGRTSASVHENNSLSVENKVGVGTESPEGKLDVRASSEETGFEVHHGAEATLTLKKGHVITDDTTDLTVGGQTHLSQHLNVHGAAHFNHTLNANGPLLAHDVATFKNHAQCDSTLNVIGTTDLSDVNASEKASFAKQLIVQGDAKYAQSVAIGLGTDDNHNADAALHIKQGIKPAFIVANADGEKTLLIKDNELQLGSDQVPATLSLKGDANVHNCLTVNGASTLLAGADVAQQLSVKQDSEQLTPEGQVVAAVNIITQNTSQSALKITHQQDETHQTVLSVQGEKVGVLTDAPQKDFHVNGEVQIDGHTHLQHNLDVSGKILAHAPVTLEDSLHIGVQTSSQENNALGDENSAAQNKARVHITQALNSNTLQVEGSDANSDTLTIAQDFIGIHNNQPSCALDVVGDVKFVGQSQFNDFMTVNQQSILLTPKLIEGQENDNQLAGVKVSAHQLTINVKDSAETFHVKGTTQLIGATQISELTISDTLTVNGVSDFNQAVRIQGPLSLNTPEVDASVDLHLRQSSLNQTALKIDNQDAASPALVVKSDAISGKLGVNTATPERELDVLGSAQISNELLAKSDFNVLGNTGLVGTVNVQANMGFTVEAPQARIHIQDDGQQDALRIDSQFNGEQAPLVYKNGMLGLGYHNPRVQLDVKGDTNISDELTVMGQTKLEHTLYVDKDALFKSDLTVNKDTELVGQAVLGQVSEIDPALTPNAQLYIADTRYKEALRIESRDHANLVFRQGKLAIGKNDPRVALDVVGELNVSQNAEIEGELEVEGLLKARDNLEVSGSMNVSQRANFGSDVRVRGDLVVEDKTNIEEELFVTGRTQLMNDLEVKLNTTLEGNLDVSGDVLLMKSITVAGQLDVAEHLNVEKNLHVKGAIHTGVNNPQGHFHMLSPAQQNAFVLDQKRTDESSQRLLTLDKDGKLGLGTDAPTHTLDVLGDACISDHLQAKSALFEGIVTANSLSSNSLNSGSINMSGELKMATGPSISAISDDQLLGGDASLNSVLATQAAVKAYIDNVAVPFGRGGKTFTVSSQRDFDALFNLSNATTISENTTVILLPFSSQGVSEYQLKNSVTLRSGVSIFGFNEQTTRIAKQNPNARFEIVGRSHEMVKNIALSGFSFDGKNLECSRDGAAFYLENASHIKLNCRIENHTSWGDGGAIFAPVSDAGQYSVSNVEALHVYNCRAMDQGSGSDTQLNEGGAAYGLYRSVIHAFDCQAERGGAVAKCKECQVEAYNCRASRSGGAAYRCELLRLTARDCVANMQNGKGGAAYYCSDLVCEGIWTGNNAAEAPHIYASNHQTGESEERHYWKGDYVGRRIDDDASVWRTHNE